MNSIKFISLIGLLSICLIQARNDVLINVQSPNELKSFYQNRKMDVTVANFGYVPYGKNLIGNVHLAEPFEACGPLKTMNIDQGNDPAPILLTKRGGCTFVSKAHYAQLIGAKLILVIDTVDEQEQSVILVDDGYGYDINIPTLMISHYDGENLLKYANSTNEETKNNVALSFKFPLPIVNSTVKYELWMSAGDIKSLEFIRLFKKYQDQLNDHDQALFEPHYALWYCSFCKNNGFSKSNPNCLSNGRYCAPDPDQNGPLTGRDIVIEDLRQICIHKKYPIQWWTYIERFEEKCINKTVSDFQKCSELVQKDSGIDADVTNKCVQDSFTGSKNMDMDDNLLLQKERQLFQGEGVQIWPSLIINNVTYRGNLLPVQGVFNAICNSFSSLPDACKQNYDQQPSGLSTTEVVVIVFFSVSFFLCIVMIFYKRHIRREMNKELQLQVNTAISQYFALSDNNKSGRN